MYDSTDYAINTFNVPVVAYSGEIDGQKQAADAMADAMLEEGLKLEHLIGPNTGHAYEAGARQRLQERLDEIASRGRNPAPPEIRFTTWMLRYNKMFWITVDAMGEEWQRGRVNAKIDGNTITATTSNVTAMHLDFAPAESPFPTGSKPILKIDEATVTLPAVSGDRSLKVGLVRNGTTWKVGEAPAGLRKSHGLQGPIDDAFMDRFVMVRPSGKALNEKVGAWAEAEMQHAVTHWRKHFRGDATVVSDRYLTPEHIAKSNLVLWGDPSSNSVLAKIADKLPVKWTADGVTLSDKTYPAGTHVPVLIYPNPLNPKKYVVLNSGFTFREYDYLNNARQVPKLPDWAVIDVTSPVTSRSPGKVVSAGFFDESWQLKK